jgi:5-(carboxyamino)imidazole ribonucleotide synthase
MTQAVGIIGGGQLAGMMAEAAKSLGIKLIVQTSSPDDPAVRIASSVFYGAVGDAITTAEMARHCDVISFENEFVDLAQLQVLAQAGVCFRPSLESLAPLLDKWEQRTYLQSMGLPVPAFWEGTAQTLAQMAFPKVIKIRRHGYDGQGTFIVRDRKSWEEQRDRLAAIPLLIEEYIPFQRELAVMAARGLGGEIAIYSVVESIQKNQVCRQTIAPASLAEATVKEIEQMTRHLLESLQFVGILGLEFFETATGQILINEIAPRTHNSGHYTLDACETSQFEMQLRAILGLPLGSPRLTVLGAIMINLLGYEHSEQDYSAQRKKIAAIPQAKLHWYGKKGSRLGRKLGHVTVLITEAEDLNRDRILARIQEIEKIWYPPAFLLADT